MAFKKYTITNDEMVKTIVENLSDDEKYLITLMAMGQKRTSYIDMDRIKQFIKEKKDEIADILIKHCGYFISVDDDDLSNMPQYKRYNRISLDIVNEENCFYDVCTLVENEANKKDHIITLEDGPKIFVLIMTTVDILASTILQKASNRSSDVTYLFYATSTEDEYIGELSESQCEAITNITRQLIEDAVPIEEMKESLRNWY